MKSKSFAETLTKRRAPQVSQADVDRIVNALIRDAIAKRTSAASVSKQDAPPESAESKIAKRADELMKAHPKLTRVEAEAQAIEQDPALYDQYNDEPHAAPAPEVTKRTPTPAEFQITKRAQELRQADPTLTQVEAEVKALEENPALYSEYLVQQNLRR